MRALLLAALLPAALAGCERPPPSAYVNGSAGGEARSIDLGRNEAGEPCAQAEGPGARTAAILCGTWTDPAARVAGGDPAPAGGLAALAGASGWRQGLEARAACEGAPEPATVLGAPALRLSCHLRLGGWPYVGIATIIDGHGWTADGVAPAEAPMVRGIGVLAGRLPPRSAAAADPGLTARRAASAAFAASDMAHFGQWLRDARSANNAGDYGDAADADQYIADLQRRVLGPDNQALARTLTDQAVQVSDLGRFGEAAKLLDNAERLARSPDQADPNAVARVLQARGLDFLNRHRYDDALAMLRRAEAAFAANAPPGIEAAAGRPAPDRALSIHDASEQAIFGVAETKRAQAVALRHLGRFAESDRAADAAAGIAEAFGLSSAVTRARLARTQAFVAEDEGRQAISRSELLDATAGFAQVLPGSVTYARTALLLGAREAAAGATAAGLGHCRAAIATLRTARHGIEPALLLPCLDLLDSTGAGRDEMFEAAQLAQGTTTSREIAQATARLQASAQNPEVGKLLRQQADLNADLDTLSQRQLASGAADPVTAKAIAGVRRAQAENNLALQAAAPSYRALVQEDTPARDVLAALHPDEAFLSVVLGPDRGWAFLLRHGRVLAAPVPGGAARMAALVAKVRASLDSGRRPPPAFDTQAAADLYDALLRPFPAALDGARALVVAPSGPLLSLPFGVLLTGPASPDALAAAPWLVQRVAVAHVPSPASFVSLRQQAGRSRAAAPWLGFGGVQPPTLAQAGATFPAASCGRAAGLLARLPPLPGTRLELDAVRQILGGSPADQLLGPAFTRDALLHADLQRARILHFATHAILPTDLPCISEPGLVVSTPPAARDAAATFLTSSDVATLKLDADLVILSACNSGGAQDGAGGESLSGLARSFLHAGTRALLVTHWAVNDRTTAYLVALTAAKLGEVGPAAALAAAQRQMIAEAQGDLALQAHPFYWAPLAAVGADAGGGAKLTASAR